MNGIATGAGVGVIRGISASESASALGFVAGFHIWHNTGLPVACNWAVGSFILVACGTW